MLMLNQKVGEIIVTSVTLISVLISGCNWNGNIFVECISQLPLHIKKKKSILRLEYTLNPASWCKGFYASLQDKWIKLKFPYASTSSQYKTGKAKIILF